MKQPLATLVLITFVLAGCSGESPDTIVPRQEAEAPTVSVTRIVLRPITESLTASGLLVAREEASVGAEIGGYRISEVLVEEGARVTAGQPLARLDPGLLASKINQAEAAVKQAKALAAQATAEAERVKSFKGSNVLSAEQIAARRFQAQNTAAGVEVAQAQLSDLRSQEAKMLIRTPVAGTVLERTVRPGDVSSLSQSLFRVARDSLMELDTEVPEDALARIALDDVVTVMIPSGAKIRGSVRLISPRVDPLTKLGRVRVSLPRHSQLRVGGYARAVFNRQATPVAAVPEKAVQFEAGGPKLITIDAQNRAHPVSVKTGARDDGFVAIEDGPPVGTLIALGSGVFLLEGDVVTPVTAEPTLSEYRAQVTR